VARKTFFSFHYAPDCWRASQVRNIGTVEGNEPVKDNEWETITKGGDPAIKKWIDGQLSGRSCAVILIGSATAGRKWINYEIEEAWNASKGVVGIHIHNLLNSQQQQAAKGANPFDAFTMKKDDKTKLSSIVKTYDPPYSTSTDVYAHIKNNLSKWVEEAVSIRNAY
jgi:hypothetical protein